MDVGRQDFQVWTHAGQVSLKAISPQIGAELYEADRSDSTMLAKLREGTVLAVSEGWLGSDWQRVVLPVVGWVESNRLRSVPPEEAVEQMAQAEARLLEAMQQVRLMVSGPEPTGRHRISTEELKRVVKEKGLHRSMGRGSCHVVHGCFLEKGFWVRHTWLKLGDCIADCTADQFDAVPRLWWPADESRYKPDPRFD